MVQEANAIDTTWLRMQLLDAGDRARMQAVLRRYVDARVAFGAASSPEQELAAYRHTGVVQAELWHALMEVLAPFRDSPRAMSIVATTNDAIDLAATRYATRQAHIPVRIVRMLILVAWLAAGLVGYERGRQRWTTVVLFLSLTLAIVLVVDLDRPSTGVVSVPQDAMLELQASLRR